MNNALRIIISVFLCVTLASTPAKADDFDLWPFMFRYAPEWSWTKLLVIASAMMLANYSINVLVIGLPAVKIGPIGRRQAAISLMWLTMLGQLADRLGAILALVVTAKMPVFSAMLSPKAADEMRPPWETFFALSFVFSGLAVGGLALYFLRRRWQVAPRPSKFIAAAAAVFTNPALVLLAFGKHFS